MNTRSGHQTGRNDKEEKRVGKTGQFKNNKKKSHKVTSHKEKKTESKKQVRPDEKDKPEQKCLAKKQDKAGKPVMQTEKKSAAARCPYYKKCGGCQYIQLSYEEQLKKKQKYLTSLLGGFSRIQPIIGMENPYHYRNKVHGVVGTDRKGNGFTGIYEEKSHRLVPVDCCLLEDQKADAIMQSIAGMMRSFKMKAYHEDTGYGFLRHILIRTGRQTGQILVVLVTASPVFPSKNNFVKALRKLHPEITSIVVNVNDRNTSMVLGDKEQILYGKGYIEDILCSKSFRISPKSFYQINPVQTEILYRKAIEYASLTGKETVIDAYSGIGTIGIMASEGAKEVLSVELNGDAVRDAKINAKRNQIHNIRFFKADAGDFMVRMAAQGQKADVVFMDPPRSGSDRKFLDALLCLAPKRIVYISCGPESLQRDLKYLTAKGYRVKKIQPIDMFAQTYHVETVCLLSKLNAKQHIEINLDMDELDLTDAEKKATYQEIKDYVLAHSGLKVSSLYIAQVKQKCGIIERENYNKPKSEDAKQPQCPPDKEKAIKEALQHFGMI